MKSLIWNITIWVGCLQLMFHITYAANLLNQQQLKLYMIDSNEVNIDNSDNEIAHYYRLRQELIDNEFESSFGNDIELNSKEQLANKIIIEAKEDEYKNVVNAPSSFTPSHHIFETFERVKSSKLFQIIEKMPKGGILHAHDTALCSTDYVVSLTYKSNLWQYSCYNATNIEKFLFALNQPDNIEKKTYCSWRLVKDVRREIGAAKYDAYVRTLFTLYDKNVNPKTQFSDINDVWSKFLGIFQRVTPILTYATIWKEYYKQALKEMLNDGVQYLEFRSTLPPLYDLNGNEYDEEDSVRMFEEALNEFKRKNPTFIGSKVIYAPRKSSANESIDHYFDVIRKLHANFPFVAGFDLVGQEDTAPPLVTYADRILKLPKDIKFFFHAGETNWFGTIDENLIDAILLGSRRIGHGYGLIKHPKLVEMVKARNITIEVNPISNQVLKLVDDFRNHPASVLVAQNVQIVISSDDPSFWEVSKLSHDFYTAFLGIFSYHSDLRTLKKLAITSIQCSSLDKTEKIEAFAKWQIQWDTFIDNIIVEPNNL